MHWFVSSFNAHFFVICNFFFYLQKDSFYEIDELKLLVKRLLTENGQLKSRIDSGSSNAYEIAL